MAFNLFDRVRIDDKDVVGDIVDISADKDGNPIYTVQSSKRGYVNDPEAYNGDYPLYDCRVDQLTKI